MLKCYKPRTVIYINGFKPIQLVLYGRKISETPLKTEIININWDNAEEEINKFDSWSIPFGITKTRKGLKIFWWDEFTNIKQWKTDLNMKIETTWQEYKPSLKEIIDFSDSDKAIQYLVEKGLIEINCSKLLDKITD